MTEKNDLPRLRRVLRSVDAAMSRPGLQPPATECEMINHGWALWDWRLRPWQYSVSVDLWRRMYGGGAAA